LEKLDASELHKKKVMQENCDCDDLETKIVTINQDIDKRRKFLEDAKKKAQNKEYDPKNVEALERQTEYRIKALQPKLAFLKKLKEEDCNDEDCNDPNEI